MQENNSSGITVDGNVPLEQYLANQESVETVKDVEKEVKDQKKKLHHKPRTRYVHEERHSRTRHLSRREINRDYVGDNMKTTKSLPQKCIVLLLRGEAYTPQEMFKSLIVEVGDASQRPKNAGAVSWALRNIDQSELGALMTRTNVGTGKAKKWEYQMLPPATHMELQDAIALYKKTGEGRQFHLADVADKYDSIKDLLQNSTKGEGFKEPQTQTERRPAPASASPIPEVGILEGIEKAIEDQLGVRVEVVGKIDINVNFGLTAPKS